ncbi:hypothetical protein [Sporomusa termitida]|nr:hypothetical protein [Sporomusa termitida]
MAMWLQERGGLLVLDLLTVRVLRQFLELAINDPAKGADTYAAVNQPV